MKDIIEKYGNLPFQWGTNDCCLFSANVLYELKGVDYAKDLRGRYSSKEGAYKLLDRVYSTDSLVRVVSIILNKEMSEDFTKTKLGDLVCFDNKDNTYSIGVSYGTCSYFISEHKGLIIVPNRICKGFWDINDI